MPAPAAKPSVYGSVPTVHCPHPGSRAPHGRRAARTPCPASEASRRTSTAQVATANPLFEPVSPCTHAAGLSPSRSLAHRRRSTARSPRCGQPRCLDAFCELWEAPRRRLPAPRAAQVRPIVPRRQEYDARPMRVLERAPAVDLARAGDGGHSQGSRALSLRSVHAAAETDVFRRDAPRFTCSLPSTAAPSIRDRRPRDDGTWAVQKSLRPGYRGGGSRCGIVYGEFSS